MPALSPPPSLSRRGDASDAGHSPPVLAHAASTSGPPRARRPLRRPLMRGAQHLVSFIGADGTGSPGRVAVGAVRPSAMRRAALPAPGVTAAAALSRPGPALRPGAERALTACQLVEQQIAAYELGCATNVLAQAGQLLAAREAAATQPGRPSVLSRPAQLIMLLRDLSAQFQRPAQHPEAEHLLQALRALMGQTGQSSMIGQVERLVTLLQGVCASTADDYAQAHVRHAQATLSMMSTALALACWPADTPTYVRAHADGTPRWRCADFRAYARARLPARWLPHVRALDERNSATTTIRAYCRAQGLLKEKNSIYAWYYFLRSSDAKQAFTDYASARRHAQEGGYPRQTSVHSLSRL